MTRRVPIIPTIIVLAAVAVMISLGFWQFGRLAQKEALIASYGQAQAMSAEVPFPLNSQERARASFRYTSFDCPADQDVEHRSGRNAQGQPGWAHWGTCHFPDGSQAEVNIGWSNQAQSIHWTGGRVQGIIVPDGPQGARVVAMVPLEGLAANAAPDPAEIPNNHLSYAIQWFFFALTALVIYALALRKRWRDAAPK